LSDLSTASLSTITTPIPYFIIQGNECFIDWLIKRILLIFQGCYSVHTINDYIPSFSTINIQWLTASQIQGLRIETIEQLALNQLYAFSQDQEECFSYDQRQALSMTIAERLRRTFEIALTNLERNRNGTEASSQQPVELEAALLPQTAQQ
jgi:hypothetical protein